MVSAPVAEPVAEDVPAVSLKSLADVAQLAETNRDIAFKVLVRRCIRPVKFEPGKIEVSLTNDAPRTLLNDLTVRLKNWTGRHWMVSLSKEDGGATLAEMESAKRENAILDARSDPTVAAILSRFPGAQIIDVRIPDAPEPDAETIETPIDSGLDEDDEL